MSNFSINNFEKNNREKQYKTSNSKVMKFLLQIHNLASEKVVNPQIFQIGVKNYRQNWVKNLKLNRVNYWTVYSQEEVYFR